VAAAVRPVPSTVVAHLAGSLGLDVLASHERRASVHPLVSLPDADPIRLKGAWFAVAGDPMAAGVVDALGGRVLRVRDEDRAAYPAAACLAANPVVALLGPVARGAGSA